MSERKTSDQIGCQALRWEKTSSVESSEGQGKEYATEEGIAIKSLYTPQDLTDRGIDYAENIGFPGKYPFTRGIHSTKYRGNEWLIRQSVGYSSLEESNQFLKKLNSLGQTRIWAHCDLPTQTGRDSDDPSVRGEVGRLGLPLSSLRDWEIVFDGIDISEFHLHVQMNTLASVSIACHLALAEKKGIKLAELHGYSQNDILKEYAGRGLFRFPPGPSMKMVTDALIYCSKHAPKFKSITQVTSVFRDTGANRIHEMAFGMSCGIAYLEEALRRGADIDEVAPQIAWNVKGSHVGFLEEVAKIRAARKVWARVLKQRFGAKKPESMVFWAETKNQGDVLTKEEPINNLTRSAIATLASALAGVQDICVMTPSEPLGIPSQEASIMALRVGEIVAFETGVTNTVDPLAGSYFLESLTSEYEERILKEIDQVDELGGMQGALEKGYIRRVLREDLAKRQRRLENGETTLVGFNKYCRETDDEALRQQREFLKPYRPTPEETDHRIRRLQEFKKSRDMSLVQSKLAAIRKLAEEWEDPKSNLMPTLIDAVKCYVTVGEISNVFQEVFGSYASTSVRDQLVKKCVTVDHGEKRIRVMVAKVGLEGHDSGALLVTDALRDAGMDVIYTGTGHNLNGKEIVGMAIEADSDIIGLSILSGIHMEACRDLMNALTEASAKNIPVVLGGLIPDEHIPALQEMGVSAIMGSGSPIPKIIECVRRLGLRRRGV